MDELNAHDGIIVEKLGGMFVVRADSSHYSGKMDDGFGFLVSKHFSDIIADAQVIFWEVGHRDMFASSVVSKSPD